MNKSNQISHLFRQISLIVTKKKWIDVLEKKTFENLNLQLFELSFLQFYFLQVFIPKYKISLCLQELFTLYYCALKHFKNYLKIGNSNMFNKRFTWPCICKNFQLQKLFAKIVLKLQNGNKKN